jgi:hypothetical protein
MSLKHAANHLAAHGRGPDTELVHMTKGEINSLQSLARANGGSLTINPDTGLAEAGFLSSILPMALGAGAMYLSGGTAAPLLGGLGMGMSSAGVIGTGIGALQYARTGSLQKGLMAGLGAYGGAGLAGGLMAPSASAMNAEVAKSAAAQNPQLMASEIGREMGQAGFVKPQIAAGMNPTVSTGPFSLAGKEVAKFGLSAAAPALLQQETPPPLPTGDNSMPQRLQYSAGAAMPMPAPDVPDYGNLGQDFGRMQSFYPAAGYQQITSDAAKQMRGYAGGGMAAGGGPVELMSDQAAIGANTGYPMANMTTSAFATPYQDPRSTSVLAPAGGASVNQMTGELNPQGTRLAGGGLSDARYNLGGYSDGGRLLRGPGDGVSDSIPAMIGQKQPARLADGEFVVPARIVSELGNGSTEAGARRLYAMMDRVQKARGKTVGKGKVAVNSKADKLLPA